MPPARRVFITAATVAFCLARAGVAQARPNLSAAVGIWRGTSTCMVRPSACNDEVAVYHISRGKTSDSLSIDGRRVVNGQEQEMGILGCRWAPPDQLTCTIPQGVWRFTVRGDSLVGELRSANGTKTRDVRTARSPSATGHEDDGFWKTATPASLGMNLTALAAHQALCERTGADACMVVYHGLIVQEWYSPRYQVPMYAMSSTKSVAGLLVGMLIDDGRIKNIDEPVCKYIASWCAGVRGEVTLRHVVSMTSGLPMMQDSGVGNRGEKNAFVISLLPTHQPGTTWAYSNEGAQLLSPILDKAAGEPIQDYATRRLFAPLGMRETKLHVYPENAWTYADMETTLRDFARLGPLMLANGMWQGKRIVSESWVKASTQPLLLNPHYGFLWWIDPEIKGYASHGHLDTDVHVIPDLDLVVVRMQSKPMAGSPEGTYEREGLKLFRTFVGSGNSETR